MKKAILIIVFSFLTAIFIILLYPIKTGGIQKFTENKDAKESVVEKEKLSTSDRIIEKYSKDIYFWGRPSPEDYKKVKNDCRTISKKDDTRIEAFTAKAITVERDQIPGKMAIAAGSSLNPNVSIEVAKIQEARIAKARNIDIARIDSLLMEHTSKRLIGVLGPQKINVLFLNRELDKLK